MFTIACCLVVGLGLGLGLGLNLMSDWLVVMHTYLYYFCHCHAAGIAFGQRQMTELLSQLVKPKFHLARHDTARYSHGCITAQERVVSCQMEFELKSGSARRHKQQHPTRHIVNETH